MVFVDIYLFGENSLKVKTRRATLAIDPKASITKFDADAVLLTGQESEISRVTNYRLVIDGPGEYEISGLKIGGIKSDGKVMYVLLSDRVDALIAKASTLKQVSADKIGDHKIVIIDADEEVSESLVTAMEPSIVVVYGQKATEATKALGKEAVSASSKISFSEDKLPEETEVLLLR